MSTEKNSQCLNCGEQLHGEFCAHCGQKNTPVNQGLGYFLKMAFDEITGYDSRLMRTLKFIFAKPGKITYEHNQGVRNSFIPPLRLYLFVSLILFVSLNLAGYTASSNTAPSDFDYQNYVQPEVPFSFYLDMDSDETRIYRDKLDYLANRMDDVNQGYVNAISQAMFLLLPFFAIYLKLLLLDKKQTIVQHIIYALHFHIFLFIAGLFLILLYKIYESMIWVFSLWGVYALYLIISLKNAYQLHWIRALFTAVVVTFLHFASFIYVQEVLKTVVVMAL